MTSNRPAKLSPIPDPCDGTPFLPRRPARSETADSRVQSTMHASVGFTAPKPCLTWHPNGGRALRPELEAIWEAIGHSALPETFEECFGAAWSSDESRFPFQETYIIDFKEKVPTKFADGYGAGFVRLALAFYNTFGGLIVIGIKDREQSPVGLDAQFNVEGFNRVLSDLTAHPIETIYREYLLPGSDNRIGVILVPKRGLKKPAILNRDFDKYSKGTLWVRDRHQVKEAESHNLPLPYSSREELPSDQEISSRSIHKALPPTPATIDKFIGRESLLCSLWDWFVFGDQPRLYLHGPGGSGKSTLAFEFSRTLADAGLATLLRSGDRVDYVLFITGKETELDSIAGKQRQYVLRQFSSAASEFRCIIEQSGVYWKEGELPEVEDDLLEIVGELFDSFNGLIVIDDIDALSRRGEDTGEEALLLKAVCGKKRTRLLYTLRHPPAHARKHALAVPGLKDEEFCHFLEACCEQFGVAKPTAEQMITIQEETSSLPLLIENVVGLRKHCSSFPEAIAAFREKGGDEARRYLYQREYDRLDDKGRAREVLACLAYLEQPVAFSTITNLLSFSNEQVRDALGECSGIFLTTDTGESGDTLYTVTPSARPFLVGASDRLNRADLIKRRVELFIREGARYTPEETSMIVRMERMLAQRDFGGVLSLAASIRPNDPVLANPRIQASIGIAGANSGSNLDRDKARESFRAASAMKYHDVKMMRAWFHLERNSGYGLETARSVAQVVIESKSASSRIRSEFISKLADCDLIEARNMQGVSSERSRKLFRQSIARYVEAAIVGKADKSVDLSKTLDWLDQAIGSYARYLSHDLGGYFDVLEDILALKQDLDEAVVELLLIGMRRLNFRVTEANRPKLIGLLSRAISRLDRATTVSGRFPGLESLREALDRTRSYVDRQARAAA